MTGVAAEAPLPAATRARVLLPFAGCTLIWGSTWLVIRQQFGAVPPEWSIAWRFVIACVAMFGVAAAMRVPIRLSARAHGLALLIGVSQFVLNYQFVYRSETFIASGLVAVVSALMLVPNAVFARLFLGHGLSRPFLLGSAIALGGIALLFAHEAARDGADATRTLLGVALAVAGLVCASAANVLQGTRFAAGLPSASLLAWGMLYGAVVDAGWAWVAAGPPVFDTGWRYVAGVLYLAIAGSVVAFTLYLQVIRTIGPARAAYSSVLTPVLAMALSTLFEGYAWSLTAAAGAALALAGLVVALRAKGRS